MRPLDTIKTWLERSTYRGRTAHLSKRNAFFSSGLSSNDRLAAKIDQARKRGNRCALILLHLENFGQMLHPGRYEQIISTQQAVCRVVAELLPDYFGVPRILGIRHYHGEDYCIYIELLQDAAYTEAHYKALQLRDSVQKQISELPELQTTGKPTFGLGFFVMEPEPASTPLAMSIAYHYAQGIATGKLSPNFTYTKEQLSDIIKNKQIQVLSQPIMDLHDGAIFGWEILARGPENTPFHRPTELFDYAYQADMLSEMELLVVEKTFHEMTERQIGEQVFVNMTSVSLEHPSVYDTIVDYLSKYPGVNPKQIVFEITERHAIRDYRQTADMMGKYRELGFRFALDDAGAGYASLQSISELVPDMIKIDRSLIANIDQGKVKQSLLKALIEFARDINCEVIAEGIERKEEADIVYRSEITKGQGYYFAKPAPQLYGYDGRLHLEQTREKIRLNSQISNMFA